MFFQSLKQEIERRLKRVGNIKYEPGLMEGREPGQTPLYFDNSKCEPAVLCSQTTLYFIIVSMNLVYVDKILFTLITVGMSLVYLCGPTVIFGNT